MWGPGPTDGQRLNRGRIRWAVRACVVGPKIGEAAVTDEWARGHCDGSTVVYSDSNSNYN
jgi:hypothetical protein